MSQFPTPPGETRTIELLGRIHDGEDEAWSELYRLYHDELLFAVRMNLGTRLRAALESEDVLQSVALEAFKALPRFEHRGEGSLRAFLHRLVLNKIRDRADTFKARKRAGAVPLTDSMEARIPGPGGEPIYNDSERFEQLERCMNRLPPEMREVVLLRKVEGLSGREVAERMNRSEDAERKAYSRAMARLTLLMKGAEES
jgi:RNA polymerase sigma-70 factor (ECF subfamily)